MVDLLLLFLPYPELEAYRTRSRGLVIRDRNGSVLRVAPARDGVKREWAAPEDIPAGAVRVFIRAEDRRFYFHPGVDLISVAGSALRNLRAGRVVSGASTITMQLARLIRPRDANLPGKIGEAWDALRLEARLSKREILELWLNGIPFGSNIEGVPAMARARFGISAARLDDSRAVLLAVIPRRPARYDPASDPEAAVAAAAALALRCRLGLSEAAIREAAREASRRDVPQKAPFYAPHFTERLISMRLGSPAGNEPGKRPGNGGALRTTLDLGLQSYAEERLEAELAMLAHNRVSTGAILAIENETGAVRVYVGSASWFNEDRGGKIDGVRVLNQPGSCLKPFLYALALDRGFSPADVLPDLPTIFGGGEAYIPANFNRRFNGPVRFRVALASSLNIPAVQLLERLGVGAFEDYLLSLGFDSLAPKAGSHGTGLALGNAEVSLEELVRGFSVFPQGGSLGALRWVEGEGEAEAEGEANPAGVSGGERPPEEVSGKNPDRRVMSPYAAALIADILSDRASRFAGFGPAPALATEFTAIFKTGTANQFQHIWALGATKDFTVGVWMGNFSGETVVGRTGSSIPARIAADLLTALEQSVGHPRSREPENPLPGLAEEVRICALSGMAATAACPGTLGEWIPRDRLPRPCSWHGAGPVRYPPEYQAWIAERFRAGGVRREGSGHIRIPVPGSVYYLDPGLPPEAQALRVETTGFSPGALVYAGGLLAGNLNPAGVYVLPLSRGQQRISVEDEAGNSASVEFEVR
ncbi:MAG: transglycosylase domain-containing protein [Spirochaetaceae bacterium]|jgi:penicillin-binding protein 1C|nr:transglycosylase domain-containing protein [Spirochaetaceae bacterium]